MRLSRMIFVAGAAAAVAALVFAVAPWRAAPVRSAYFDAPLPLVIAHQGGDGLRPSNTIPAFDHAAELGVDVLEMDVHETRDGALVLMHDATVDRTTDGSGALADMTLAQVQALDAAHHWPYDGAPAYRGLGIGVPTLAEVISRHRLLRFNVEIKPPSAETGRAVCAELQRLGVADRVLVASFHATAMDAFREACPLIPTSGYESEVRWFYLQYRLGLWRIARPAVPALQVPQRAGAFDLTEPGFLEAARSRGMHVDFWTVNDADEMRTLLRRGAAGIITDRPDLLLEVLGRQ
jgi:glycerophosphoryl diester phosphodiesterase